MLLPFRSLLNATLLMSASLMLHANVLLPGDSNRTPDVFPDPGDVTPLNLTSGTFSFGSGPGLITGTYFEAVVVDPLGIGCPGCLDFAFQFSLDSGLSAGLFNLSLSRFFGYTTHAGYIDASGIAPVFVNRGAGGGGLSFAFATPTGVSNIIGPGDSSAILVVGTNAKTYDAQGFLGVSGGRSGSPANGQITGVFEPTLQAPEPSTALLLGIGIAGFAYFCNRS